MSEIRYSKFDDKYVIIAPERFHKPDNIVTQNSEDVSNCPFCPENENKLEKEIFSIRENGKWLVKVVPNLYKALSLENKFESHIINGFEFYKGFGVHEVIIDTPRHIKIFEFNKNEWMNLFITIKARITDLKKDSRIKYLSIFKNYGLKAGASQTHPHSQIIGMPLLPKVKKELLKREFEYYKKHGRKFLKDIVEEEMVENKRVLYKTQNFISFMPFASLFPFEIMIASFEESSYLEMNNFEELAVILQKSINLLYQEIGEFDFNIEFFEPPINKNFDNEEFFDEIKDFHLFYVRIRPRIFNLAGFEIMNEITINPVEPEFIKKVLEEII
jgi:UDPglucose--hexose-1-phosphate uridylyltransferase